jgi:gamma-glutamylputrescine oxidase
MAHIDSYYARLIPREGARAPLAGAVETDVAVIGGGLSGLSAAISLIEQGHHDVTVLEARRIGWGASGRNAGIIAPGFTLDPMDVVTMVGRDHARKLFALSREAVELVRGRIDRYRIACAASYTGVVKAWWTPGIDDVKRQLDFVEDLVGVRCELWTIEQTRETLVTDRYHHAVFAPDAFQLNPLDYCRGLGEAIERGGGRIHEDTPVRAIDADGDGFVVRVPHGELRARRVLIACGGYVAGLVPEVARALLPIATHVMVTAPLGDRLQRAVRTRAAVFDSRNDHDYYRVLTDGRLLFGGGISVRGEAPEAASAGLRRRLLDVYPQLKDGLQIDAVWGGTMDFPRHLMPMLGQTRAGVWYAAGNAGHGLGTTAMLGDLFARAVTTGDDTYRLLSPFRLQWAGGLAGLAAAQITYWYYRALDALAS